jgi:hypothetical protein
MVPVYRVLVSSPDEDENGTPAVDAVLRILDRTLALTRRFQRKRADYWLTWKFRSFRGPWPLQVLVTPLCAFNGILFSKGDMRWIGEDTNEPRLRITPFVPAEFWVDIRFQNEQDAATVAGLIEVFWCPEARWQHDGWSQRLRRWPVVFAAPFFVIPLTIGSVANDEFWFRLGAGAFFAFVVIGMVLACRHHAREERHWHGDRRNGSLPSWSDKHSRLPSFAGSWRPTLGKS